MGTHNAGEFMRAKPARARDIARSIVEGAPLLPCWTRYATAKTYLADCGQNPPEVFTSFERSLHAIGDRGGHSSYSNRDPRVGMLRALRREWINATAQGDSRREFDLEHSCPEVDDEIDAAIRVKGSVDE